MSCCGKKRSNAGLMARETVASAVVVQPYPFAAAAGTSLRGPKFEYLGGSVLTVTGQGTGMQYRFVGHGARASVDPRDRASLARVPQLREEGPQ
jgi:hypothetical protein